MSLQRPLAMLADLSVDQTRWCPCGEHLALVAVSDGCPVCDPEPYRRRHLNSMAGSLDVERRQNARVLAV